MLGQRPPPGLARLGLGNAGGDGRADLGGFEDLEVFELQLELVDDAGQPFR